MLASYKLNFTNPRPRGRPLKRWADGIRENSGVPLLTLERRAADREAYKSQCSCVLQGDAKSYATKSYIYNYVKLINSLNFIKHKRTS